MVVKKKNEGEPLWCTLYREQVLKPLKGKRETEQRGRTEASRSGFYASKAWILLRDRRRKENPLCQLCEPKGFLRPGKIVDHKVPVDVAPELALEFDNTQHICHPCNDWKTKEDQRQKVKAERLKRGRELMKQFESH